MQTSIDFLSHHAALALAVVFAAAVLESVALIGTVVPGSAVVIGAGVLIGLGALDPWAAVLAVVGGAILGDGFSYWLGRHHQDKLRAMWPLTAYPALLDRGQTYFAEHGGKSVFFARFLSPVRAVVPLVAGMSSMPPARFAAFNVLSAFAWAAAHLLPGVLFGASLGLAAAVGSHLVIALLMLALAVWACVWLLRLIYRGALPVLARSRERIVAWARARHGVLAGVLRSLLDPARPESFGLLVAALLLLGATALFFAVLEDVMTNDTLVRVDQVVFTALQQLRSAGVERVMIVATEIGSVRVALPVIVAVGGVLAWKRCWRTLAYWLTAVGFAQALVWTLKTTLGRARPIAIYEGVERFSFPSGHAASSIVLYGFLAFLLAREHSRPVRSLIAAAATLLVTLISFSRLYLGAHWLSDVVASLSLGTAWVALLAIVYTQHATNERLPWRSLLAVGLSTLVLASAWVVTTNYEQDQTRYALRPAASALPLPDWQAGAWRRLPAFRSAVDGDRKEPFGLQWAADEGEIEQRLRAAGWRPPVPWDARSAASWLLASTSVEALPVLPKLNEGAPAALTYVRTIDPSTRSVVRLWHAGFNADAAPLWLGMVTRERLHHPLGVFTLARTERDVAAPLDRFAQALRAQGVALQTVQRDATTLLLIR